MGTRADFWKHKNGPDGWLGSTAWDGYPEGIVPTSSDRTVVAGTGIETAKYLPWPAAFAANAQATAQEHTGTTIAELMIDPDRHGMPELVANLEVPGMSFEAVSIGEMGALLQSMLGGGHDA